MTVTQYALAQGPAPAPEHDPDDNSGWLQLEVAVLTDTRPQTLESEFWPPNPEVSYPARFRWLENISMTDALNREWTEARLEHSDVGAVQLYLADPDQTIENAVTAEREAQAAAALLADPDQSSDAEISGLQQLAIDDSTLYTENADPTVLDAGDAADSAHSPENTAITAAIPRVLPTPFQWRQPVQLAEGLKAYLRATPDKLRYQAAWLQPPKAANLPIVLDLDEQDTWPQLQGFIQLKRGQSLRLGINIWLNTLAEYYPESYVMAPPPSPPIRVTWRAEEDGQLLTQREALQRQQRLARFRSAIEAGVTPMSFVDRRPSRPAVPLSNDLDSAESALTDTWPWRHLIHVADTRTLPEGAVRYFDHPVIKVIATWRELTWGEIYALGDAELAAACEASTAASTDSVGSASPQCSVRVGNAASAP